MALQAAEPEGDSLTKGPKLRPKICLGGSQRKPALRRRTWPEPSFSPSHWALGVVLNFVLFHPSPCPSVWGNAKITSPEPQLESSRLNHLNNLHLWTVTCQPRALLRRFGCVLTDFFRPWYNTRAATSRTALYGGMHVTSWFYWSLFSRSISPQLPSAGSCICVLTYAMTRNQHDLL